MSTLTATRNTDTTTTDTDTATSTPAKLAPLTFTVPLVELIDAVTATTPHASKDNMTPVITALQIVPATINGHGEDGKPIVTPAMIQATDRYTVGRYTFETPPSDLDNPATFVATQPALDVEAFMIGRDVADWLLKIAPKTLRLFRPSTYGEAAEPYAGAGHDDLYFATISVEMIPAHPTFHDQKPTRGEITVSVFCLEGKPERVQSFDPAPAGNYPPIGRLVDGWEAAETGMPVMLKPEFLEKVTAYVKKSQEKHAPFRMEIGKTSNPAKPGPVLCTVGKFQSLIQPNLLLR